MRCSWNRMPILRESRGTARRSAAAAAIAARLQCASGAGSLVPVPARRGAPLSRNRRRAWDVARRGIEFTRALSGAAGACGRTVEERCKWGTQTTTSVTKNSCWLWTANCPSSARSRFARTWQTAPRAAREWTQSKALRPISIASTAQPENLRRAPLAISRANLQQRLTAISSSLGAVIPAAALAESVFGASVGVCCCRRSTLDCVDDRMAAPADHTARGQRHRGPLREWAGIARRAPHAGGNATCYRESDLLGGRPSRNQAPASDAAGGISRIRHGWRAQPRNYEVDHLITPALGGTDDIRNLWPEPYAIHRVERARQG